MAHRAPRPCGWGAPVQAGRAVPGLPWGPHSVRQLAAAGPGCLGFAELAAGSPWRSRLRACHGQAPIDVRHRSRRLISVSSDTNLTMSFALSVSETLTNQSGAYHSGHDLLASHNRSARMAPRTTKRHPVPSRTTPATCWKLTHTPAPLLTSTLLTEQGGKVHHGDGAGRGSTQALCMPS